ncbi:hypothetical protein Tco_0882840 [Tanacetum coccineum]
MDHSLQTMHMLGLKPYSFYDPSLKSGLRYKNPCHLLKAIAQTPKLYSTASLSDNKVHVPVHVHDSKEILEGAEKSRLRMEEKLNDDEVQKKKLCVENENENVRKDNQKHVKESNGVQESLLNLKRKVENIGKGKSINSKFDKPAVQEQLICVMPFNKQTVQKTKLVPKTVEKQVLTKLVTLETLPQKRKEISINTNVIKQGMYKVNIKDTQEKQTKANESVLTSTGLKGSFSVSRPKRKSTDQKTSVMPNTNSRSTSKSSKKRWRSC